MTNYDFANDFDLALDLMERRGGVRIEVEGELHEIRISLLHYAGVAEEKVISLDNLRLLAKMDRVIH